MGESWRAPGSYWPRAEPDLDVEEVRGFLEAINARYGFDLRGYAMSSMLRRVGVALAKSGHANLGGLQSAVLTDRGLFGRVIADLTVSVSELFRDPASFRTFRERVVPLLRTYPIFNVWHAGCARGEEAYSTAMLLREEGLDDRCHIYATDLSSDNLEHAKQGVYWPRSIAAVAERYRASGGRATLDAHATIAYGQLAISESLRRRVHFFQHNLVTDHVFAKMTVVFCRNVLMYFGQDLRGKVVRKLQGSLCPGGFLFLGHSEQLPNDVAGMFSPFAARDRIYRSEGMP